MALTNKQEEAVKLCVAKYKHKEKYFCLSGYAGSGKTYTIKHIIEALPVKIEDVAYCAYTGKAASVLRQNGNMNAMTAHKLLYHSKPLPNGTFRYTPKTSLEYKVVVIDEVSMLPKDMWDLLCSHEVFVIASGDPMQLSPISANQDNHVLDHPDIFLEEIMRQAQESEIIRLSMIIREGGSIPYQKGPEVQIIPPKEVIDGMYLWADQVLVATNATRRRVNDDVRQLLGYGPEPQVGDKIVCCRNCWNIGDTTNSNALVNGATGIITRIQRQIASFPHSKLPNVDIFDLDIVTETDGTFLNVPVDARALLTGTKTLTPEQEYLFFTVPKLKNIQPPVECNFGYGMTTWKFQGSQAPKILAFEEQFPYDKEEHKKFLYTSCTRSQEKLVLVR